MPASALDNLAIVLVSPRNPLNIGAAARAMSNFGFRHLRVVDPYEVAFREARSAVGASAKILRDAKVYSNLAEAIADRTVVIGTTALRKRELQHPMRTLATGGRVLRKQLFSERPALLFGSEKRGLSNEDLSHCHWLTHIPTQENQASMNLGQAVAVCLYELTRLSSAEDSAPKGKRARAGELERLTEILVLVLAESGYLKSTPDKNAVDKIRRFVRSLNMEQENAQTLLGMFRQVGWKLQITKIG